MSDSTLVWKVRKIRAMLANTDLSYWDRAMLLQDRDRYLAEIKRRITERRLAAEIARRDAMLAGSAK
jgi:hypothetical protein